MKIILLVGSLLLASALTGCNAKDARVSFAESVSKNIIEPSYQTLYLNAVQLSNVSTQCEIKEANYPKIIGELKTHWRKTMASWQGVQWVQFGPIKEDGREWSLQFWPDKRNLVGKKINALMKNNQTVTQESLARGGVLTQGLSAMEYVLFDRLEKSIVDDGTNVSIFMRQACLSSIAISQMIKNTSQILLDGWGEYHRKNFSRLDKPNIDAEITDVQQAISLIMNNAITIVDIMQNRKLGSPFGLGSNNDTKLRLSNADVKKANAFFLESWRSRGSRSNLSNNINTLLKLFEDKSFKHLLATKNQGGLALLLEESTTKIAGMLAVAEDEASYFDQVSVSKLDAAENIKPLYKELARLKVLMTKDLVRALNIQAGFNANDGDS